LFLDDNTEERNALILFITAVLERAFGFGVTVGIARILGVQNFGLFAYAYGLSGPVSPQVEAQ